MSFNRLFVIHPVFLGFAAPVYLISTSGQIRLSNPAAEPEEAWGIYRFPVSL